MPKQNGAKAFEPDWDEFDKLLAIHCTLEEIAGWYKYSPDTIERAVKRCKKIRFADYSLQKRGQGKASLRRVAWQKALKGDNTMIIWLMKQHLEMSDKTSVAQSGEISIAAKTLLSAADDEEVRARLAKIREDV